MPQQERLLPTSSFSGIRVSTATGQPNSSVSGVQLGKFNIPRKTRATSKRFSVRSILADVAKDYMVILQPCIWVFDTYIMNHYSFLFHVS